VIVATPALSEREIRLVLRALDTHAPSKEDAVSALFLAQHLRAVLADEPAAGACVINAYEADDGYRITSSEYGRGKLRSVRSAPEVVNFDASFHLHGFTNWGPQVSCLPITTPRELSRAQVAELLRWLA